jgi:AcrR family transcriptional regulator
MPKISEEKRRSRCQHILDSAMRCFAKDGFHRTTMEDIVRESNLSPGAIYCYFRGKNEIVAAIADQRHHRESALLARLQAAGDSAKGFQDLERDFFNMLKDPQEKERRKVTIQIWAESLRDKQIRNILERGLRQRDVLTASLRIAQRKGHLQEGVDPEFLSRVMLAILQGFILQQAWEPALNIERFLETVMVLTNSVFKDVDNTSLQSRNRRATKRKLAPPIINPRRKNHLPAIPIVSEK